MRGELLKQLVLRRGERVIPRVLELDQQPALVGIELPLERGAKLGDLGVRGLVHGLSLSWCNDLFGKYVAVAAFSGAIRGIRADQARSDVGSPGPRNGNGHACQRWHKGCGGRRYLLLRDGPGSGSRPTAPRPRPYAAGAGWGIHDRQHP